MSSFIRVKLVISNIFKGMLAKFAPTSRSSSDTFRFSPEIG